MANNGIIEGRWRFGVIRKDANGWRVKSVQGEMGDFVIPLVRGYEVASEGRRIKSGVGGAALATVALGPIGLAGGLLAARKSRLAVVTWDNGEQSLIEACTTPLHQALTTALLRQQISS